MLTRINYFFLIGYVQYLYFLIGQCKAYKLLMEQTPQTPKKRTPVKKQASIWQDPRSKPLPTQVDLESLQQAVEQLQKRQTSLEEEWSDFLEHLSEQEGSMDSTQEEEGLN